MLLLYSPTFKAVVAAIASMITGTYMTRGRCLVWILRSHRVGGGSAAIPSFSINWTALTRGIMQVFSFRHISLSRLLLTCLLQYITIPLECTWLIEREDREVGCVGS